MGCSQTVKGNSEGACCAFPFTYNKRSYSNCIKDGSKRRWCATTNNYDTDKQWGYCGACHPTHGGNSHGSCCQFPFVFDNKIYTECIHAGSKWPWCATTYSYDRHQKWGYCKGNTAQRLKPVKEIHVHFYPKCPPTCTNACASTCAPKCCHKPASPCPAACSHSCEPQCPDRCCALLKKPLVAVPAISLPKLSPPAPPAPPPPPLLQSPYAVTLPGIVYTYPPPPPSIVYPPPPPAPSTYLHCPVICEHTCVSTCPQACCMTPYPPPPYPISLPPPASSKLHYNIQCPYTCLTNCNRNCPITCCRKDSLVHLGLLPSAIRVNRVNAASIYGKRSSAEAIPSLSSPGLSCPIVCSKHCISVCTRECCNPFNKDEGKYPLRK